MQLADQLNQAQASAPDQVVEAATAAEESAVSFQSELPQPCSKPWLRSLNAAQTGINTAWFRPLWPDS